VDDGYSGQFLFMAAQFDNSPRDSFDRRLPVLRKPLDADILLRRVEALLVQDAPQWDVK
jgi:hypothetical protein